MARSRRGRLGVTGTPTGPVLVERRSEVLVVTINRPEARNAVNPAVAAGIGRAMDLLDDDELRVGVITGAQGAFCAGMDLRHAAETGERPNIKGRGFAGIVERPSRKPLIAAVEGAAVGGGCEIALACDLIVAAESARFALPEVRVGLVPGGGGLFKLPGRIPYHAAMEMVLTGEAIDAERAHQLGLVSRVAPDGTALEVALELAAVIAANAPVDRKSTRLNSSHYCASRMPSSA